MANPTDMERIKTLVEFEDKRRRVTWVDPLSGQTLTAATFPKGTHATVKDEIFTEVRGMIRRIHGEDAAKTCRMSD